MCIRDSTYYGQYNYVEGASSSTSEIVYGFLEGNYPVDQDMAAGLYAGLIYDTGGFRHSSTSPNTMRVAGALMETGIPFTDIYNRFFDSRSFSEMKIMGQALENAKLYFDGKVVCATITSAEIAACNGTNKELDAIINYLKGVQGAEAVSYTHLPLAKRTLVPTRISKLLSTEKQVTLPATHSAKLWKKSWTNRTKST